MSSPASNSLLKYSPVSNSLPEYSRAPEGLQQEIDRVGTAALAAIRSNDFSSLRSVKKELLARAVQRVLDRSIQWGCVLISHPAIAQMLGCKGGEIPRETFLFPFAALSMALQNRAEKIEEILAILRVPIAGGSLTPLYEAIEECHRYILIGAAREGHTELVMNVLAIFRRSSDSFYLNRILELAIKIAVSNNQEELIERIIQSERSQIPRYLTNAEMNIHKMIIREGIAQRVPTFVRSSLLVIGPELERSQCESFLDLARRQEDDKMVALIKGLTLENREYPRYDGHSEGML